MLQNLDGKAKGNLVFRFLREENKSLYQFMLIQPYAGFILALDIVLTHKFSSFLIRRSSKVIVSSMVFSYFGDDPSAGSL